jgi:histidine triad (HIT) family protein
VSCIFCKIIRGEISGEKVFENEKILVLKDINPQAPVHFLVIPKEHFSSVLEIADEKMNLLQEVFGVIKKLANDFEFGPEGFRIVNNIGLKAGQAVGHIHFHVLAGREFFWPPG